MDLWSFRDLPLQPRFDVAGGAVHAPKLQALLAGLGQLSLVLSQIGLYSHWIALSMVLSLRHCGRRWSPQERGREISQNPARLPGMLQKVLEHPTPRLTCCSYLTTPLGQLSLAAFLFQSFSVPHPYQRGWGGGHYFYMLATLLFPFTGSSHLVMTVMENLFRLNR